jgi:hypothetical protein
MGLFALCFGVYFLFAHHFLAFAKIKSKECKKDVEEKISFLVASSLKPQVKA